MNNQIKAKIVREDEVRTYWEVYNLGKESEFISFPKSMDSNEDDAITAVLR